MQLTKNAWILRWIFTDWHSGSLTLHATACHFAEQTAGWTLAWAMFLTVCNGGIFLATPPRCVISPTSLYGGEYPSGFTAGAAGQHLKMQQEVVVWTPSATPGSWERMSEANRTYGQNNCAVIRRGSMPKGWDFKAYTYGPQSPRIVGYWREA